MQVFKGIALFTPGGDLIYCRDLNKQEHWHVHLCAGLQEIFGLPEPPYFLLPGHSATIDRWLDPQTQQLKTSAEVYPAVQRYQPLLNAVFGVENLIWQVAPWDESCNPIVLETYRNRFPQLWEERDLIVRFQPRQELSDRNLFSLSASSKEERTENYILRLFVSGNSHKTEVVLKEIYQFLERDLGHPYTLKVIDILQHPEEAETNQISATPTLVRISPLPVRRIVGELGDRQRVVEILAI
jgi:circadian clock protein KaiB